MISRGGEDPSRGIMSMCEGGEKGDGNYGNDFNGDDFNGEFIQWRATTRNYTALTLAGYNW